MPELVASKDHKTLIRVPLGRKDFKIGRAISNDLTLSDDYISRLHAEISLKQDQYFLKNVSSGGTYINKNLVTDKELQDGDIISIGDWELKFCLNSHHDDDLQKEVNTCITRIEKKQETKIVQIKSEEEKFLTEQPIMIIKSPQKNSRRFHLKEESITVGSHPNADIQVEDDYVSNYHVKLTWSQEGILIKDLQSTNGTWIDGSKVMEMSVQPPQKIKIGETKIQIFLDHNHEAVEPVNYNKFCGIIGQSEGMRKLYRQIERVSSTLHTVLIQADSGCGKELVAKAIHDLSSVRSGPYVVINCGAISPNLIESELFGHEKGAFTGANQRHMGAFEQANRGTIFLDEIGELPLDLQPKLLRVLENGTIKRVGGIQEISIQSRVIAATHRDLAKWVETKKFREDLFYRLCVLPLSIPKLKDRRDDIPFLVHYFLDQSSPISSDSEKIKISKPALNKLMKYDWPGNVRELKNVILRSVVYADDDTLCEDDIELFSDCGKKEKIKSISSLEKERIQEVIDEAKGNKTKAAELLGIARSTLFKKMKSYGIDL